MDLAFAPIAETSVMILHRPEGFEPPTFCLEVKFLPLNPSALVKGPARLVAVQQ
jgi:hypothetical protein